MGEKPTFTQNPLLNPGGAVLEVFLNGQFPDGTLVPHEVQGTLGAELIEMMTEEKVIQN